MAIKVKAELYSVLGLSPDASQEEIDEAIEELGVAYHPEGHPEEEYDYWMEKFKEVELANRVFHNSELKKKYDEELKKAYKKPERTNHESHATTKKNGAKQTSQKQTKNESASHRSQDVLYSILGLTPDASQEKVDKAIEDFAGFYNPDTRPEEEYDAWNEKWNDYILASIILGDPKRRKLYDEQAKGDIMSYTSHIDFYSILMLSPDASQEDIDKAIEELLDYYHPNNHPEEEYDAWAEKWNDYVIASIILGDPKRRKLYDEQVKMVSMGHELHTTTQKDKVTVTRLTSQKPRQKKNAVRVAKVDESKQAKKQARKAKRRLYATPIALTALLIALAAGTYACHKNDDNNVKEEVTETNNNAEEMATVEEPETLVEIEDPYIDTPVYAFTNAFDDEQVHKRAVAIHEYFERSNLHNISVEDIETTIKFINCSYIVDPDKDTSIEISNALETTMNLFSAYGTAINQQPTNFAGGVVDENGVCVALGYDAFVVDDTPNAEFLKKASTLFQNTLTSPNYNDKVEAAEQMLQQEADMMLWLEVDETDTKLSFANMDSTGGFVYGLMVQAAAPTIKSALGENYALTYVDNNGNDVNVGINTIENYYYPSCNEEGTSVWSGHLINIHSVLLQINEPDAVLMQKMN